MPTYTIFFDTSLFINEQIEMLEPLLSLWCGNNYREYYISKIDYFSYRLSDKFLIIIGRNASRHKSDLDQDRFRYELDYIDVEGKFTDKETHLRMKALLELLWKNNIPTCSPFLADDMPYGAGEYGPIPWPK